MLLDLEPVSVASEFPSLSSLKLLVNLWARVKTSIEIAIVGLEVFNSETFFSFVFSHFTPYVLYNKNLSWGMNMVGGAVNENVSPIPNKPEQAAHMLADHASSALHNLDILSCET